MPAAKRRKNREENKVLPLKTEVTLKLLLMTKPSMMTEGKEPVTVIQTPVVEPKVRF